MPDTLDNERFRLLLRTLPGKAIDYLYTHYYEGLVRLSSKYLRDRHLAEDVVQETFLHVWEQHKSLSNNHDLPIHFYLARVVKNKSITQYKKTLKLQSNYTHFLNGYRVPSAEETIERQMIAEEIAGRIRKYIDTFPLREKQCLLMKVDEGMSTKEAAARLGVSVKAVERSMTSAHKRLRQWAKKEFWK